MALVARQRVARIMMCMKSRIAASLVLALSCFLILVSLVNGNLQIAALPIAVWVGLTAWPAGPRTSGWEPEMARSQLRRLVSWVLPSLSIILSACAMILVAWSIRSGSSSQGYDVESRMAQGEDLVVEGRLVEALGIFQSMDVPGDMPIQLARKHHNCGVLLLQTGRPDDAMAHLLVSLKHDPANAQAAFLIGKILVDRGRPQEAIFMLDVSLSIDPAFERPRRLRAQLMTHSESSRPSQDRR